MPIVADALTPEYGTTRWVAANLKDALPEEFQAILDAFVTVKETIDAAYLVQKAQAALSDADMATNSAVTAFIVLRDIAKQIIEILYNFFDTGFFQLIIEPQTGGLSGYLTAVRAHMVDTSDPNRPIDQGGAFFQAVLLLVSAKDLSVASQRIDNLRSLWDSAKKDYDALKAEFTAYYRDAEQVSIMKNMDDEAFFKFYYRKRLVGSHKSVKLTDCWHKQTLGDLFPDSFDRQLERFFAGVDAMAAFNIDAYKMSSAVSSFWDRLLAAVNDVVVIIDNFKRLFTDTQISVVVSPFISAKPLPSLSAKPFNQLLYDRLSPPAVLYSANKSGVQVLCEYFSELPGILRNSLSGASISGYSAGFSQQLQASMFGYAPTGFVSLDSSQILFSDVNASITLRTSSQDIPIYLSGQIYKFSTVVVDLPSYSDYSSHRVCVYFDPASSALLVFPDKNSAVGKGVPVCEVVWSRVAGLPGFPDTFTGVVTDLRRLIQPLSDRQALQISENYTEMLRSDYYVGGVLCLFKGPSVSVLSAQVGSLLKLFGADYTFPAVI